MSEPKTQHATIMIERKYDASPARVFKAWTDIDAKSRWFTGPRGEWTLVRRSMDFRVGGTEHVSGRWPTGIVSIFDSIYHEIVPDRRIVYSFDMHLDERHITVSLATVEFKPAGKGSLMIFTEQLVNLDDWDDEGGRNRKEGTDGGFDRLEEALREDW